MFTEIIELTYPWIESLLYWVFTSANSIVKYAKKGDVYKLCGSVNKGSIEIKEISMQMYSNEVVGSKSAKESKQKEEKEPVNF